MHTHSVVFQTGGPNGAWKRALDRYTAEQAEQKRAELERMGYPAYAQETRLLDALGLPEGPSPGWDYARCRRAA